MTRFAQRRTVKTAGSAAVLLLCAFLPVQAELDVPSSLLAELRSLEFAKREAAQTELLAWGRSGMDAALEALFQQSKSSDDPEIRARCLQVVRDLVADQYVKAGEGYIGIGLADEIVVVPDQPKSCHAIRVTAVMPRMPGDQAGIKMGDLIVSLDGAFWPDAEASPNFREAIRRAKPTSTVRLGILREDKIVQVEVVLARRPVAAEMQFLMGQNFMPDGAAVDAEAAERAAREAFFRQWLAERKAAR
jgi:predicted metalloprotease with PDZ domain